MSRDSAKTLAAGLRYPFEDDVPAEGEAIEVADGILWLRLPLPMALDHVNIYALDDTLHGGDGWTIIDTGFSTKTTKRIWKAIMAGPLKGKPVSRVVATHHHPDHIGLAGWFQAEYGAELWTTRTAWLFCRALQLDHQDAVSPERITHMRRAGAPDAVIDAAIAQGPWNFSTVTDPLQGFHRLKEDDVIEMGGRRWRVLMGNGHAPEHATFWCEEDDIVIAGDQILPRISPNLGVYSTEPDADPVSEWLEACEKFKPYATERHLALPGHNRPFTGVPKRLDQLIENHHGAIRRLRKVLIKPTSAVECFDSIFKRSIGQGEFGLAMVEAIAHLNHMFATGEAKKRLDDDGVVRFWLA